jgi:hypothetical protein
MGKFFRFAVKTGASGLKMRKTASVLDVFRVFSAETDRCIGK